MGTLLKRAKLIPWRELRHSLGPAADVPALLARVAWSDQTESALALDDLRFRICRDGLAVEEATAAVVPLLWELAEAQQVPCRDEILALLSEIWKTKAWSKAAAETAGRRSSAGYAAKKEWELGAHEAVFRGRAVAERLTLDTDIRVAEAARNLMTAINERA